MWEIVGNEELEAKYKKSHPFLDDIVFIPVENGKYVQEIGHSQIWDVLAVKVVGNNRGEEILLYNYAGDWLVDQFKVSEDPDHYFSTFIEGYLPRLFI